MVKLGLIFPDRHQPFVLVDVFLTEYVPESRALRATADRRGEFLVEQWVEIDQVHAFGVDARQHVDVVIAEDGAVLYVAVSHRAPVPPAKDFSGIP